MRSAALARLILPARYLLNDPAVQAALSLPESSVADIGRRTDEYLLDFQRRREALSERLTAFAESNEQNREGFDERRRRLIAEHLAEMKSLSAGLDRSLLSLLDGSQQARLAEVNLQLTGTAALQWPETAAALRLDKGQRSRLAAIGSRYIAKAVQGLRDRRDEGGPRDVAAMRSAFETLRRDEAAECLEILLPDQQEAFRAMGGVPAGLSLRDISRELRLRHAARGPAEASPVSTAFPNAAPGR